jgi:kynureninase
MTETDFGSNLETALRLDREDPLKKFRQRFLLPHRPDGTPLVYLLGNSLGPQPASTAAYTQAILRSWAERGVHGHFEGPEPWLDYPGPLTEITAEIVGARAGEVVLMNALTVNIHLMLASFYRASPTRFKILVEEQPFPSDRYALASHLRLRMQDPAEAILECRARPGERRLRTEDIEQHLAQEGQTIALVFFGGVNYYTGQAFDLERITRAAHRVGAIAAFDLAHAAGNVLLKLHDWEVDVALWCSYKYLNAGPGSPGGVFVHERHHGSADLPRLAGWWGEPPAKRFALTAEFEPAAGAAGWQVSNPPVLMLAAYRASMEIFHEAGMERLRAKSLLLTGYLESLLDRLGEDHFTIITPRNPQERGAQLSLLMKRDGKRVSDALTEAGFLTDWRDPDVIRVAPVPLTTTFREVFDFARTFAELIGRSLS